MVVVVDKQGPPDSNYRPSKHPEETQLTSFDIAAYHESLINP